MDFNRSILTLASMPRREAPGEGYSLLAKDW